MYKAFLIMRGRHVQVATLRHLRYVERLPAAQIAELQEEMIRKLLLHAYANVPYYRRVIERRPDRC